MRLAPPSLFEFFPGKGMILPEQRTETALSNIEQLAADRQSCQNFTPLA
jgi:hypothetical protein